MFITRSQLGITQKFKDEMQKMFEMIDLGMMKYFFGMEVLQSIHDIFTCQQKYMSDILRRFKMQDCKHSVGTSMSTSIKLKKDSESEKVDKSMYRSLIDSFQYLTTSRPNILFVMNALSRLMHSPKKPYFTATKHVLRPN